MANKKQLPQIIFEDEAVLVLNKPPFLRAIPDRYREDLPNILTMMKEKFEEIFMVHRLDMETSGAIILAKTKEAHKYLNQQFEARTIDKKYLTLVEGSNFPEEGEIDSAIGKHPTIKRMRVNAKGKKSITQYKLIESFQNFALVEATILTGRMHQIRVHFESIGFPLAVDSVYGRRESLSITDIKKGKISFKKGSDEIARPLIERSTLHSWKIAFDHPTSGERMNFEAELPKDFRAVVNQMRKWRGME